MHETDLLTLDEVDPGRAWEPWQPDKVEPWNLKWAGHLYRRAAFGASRAMLQKAVADGYAATIDRLIKGREDGQDLYPFLLSPGAKATRDYELRGWWLYVMLHSPQPLLEKMTLFWHNHFATSIAKVSVVRRMYNQNLLLRQHALGNFQPFLLAISRDAAMLAYLDSDSNIKGKPNENYARELMELFSLGVGHYTEKDIREAARAFTGWHTEGDAFAFNSQFHDDGTKTVLGQTGSWDGGDIVRVVLEQKAAADFLVRKLYRYFISEMVEPPPALLEPLADEFRKSGYDIGRLVATLLRSRHFYSAHAYRQRIKGPVEFVLGAANEVNCGRVMPRALIARIEAMGQNLFAPPNVKGWEGGKNWLNSATVLARHNFAQALASGSGDLLSAEDNDTESVPNTVDLPTVVRQEHLTDPDKIVALLTDLLLQGEVSEGNRKKLCEFMKEGKPEGSALDQRVRETIHAIMTMPDYQLA
jgi:hypothetical protein